MNELNLKYNVGNYVFIAKQEPLKEVCSYCNGETIIRISNTGKETICPYCKGTGVQEIRGGRKYVVQENMGIIDSIKVTIKEDEVVAKYNVKVGEKIYSGVTENRIFIFLEDAIEFCTRGNINKKTIQLEDIIINDSFKNSIPNVKKIQDKLNEYSNMKYNFNGKITVDEHDVLSDGYITYMLAKMFDVKQLQVCISSEEKTEE